MSRADYQHWNEDADYVWWHEEGKHVEEPPEPDDGDYDNVGPLDAFAEEVGEEWDTEQVRATLDDADYMRRWPQTRSVLEAELRARGVAVQ